jgi:hypothetical protein
VSARQSPLRPHHGSPGATAPDAFLGLESQPVRPARFTAAGKIEAASKVTPRREGRTGAEYLWQPV